MFVVLLTLPINALIHALRRIYQAALFSDPRQYINQLVYSVLSNSTARMLLVESLILRIWRWFWKHVRVRVV